ncbi:MAG: hypothetical protein ACI841_003083 [Planctomycetota bacterium]|jgi:hypothetical protein
MHIGVDRSGQIHAHVLSDSSVDDASTGIGIIKATLGRVPSMSGDTAYGTVAIYDAANVRGARVVVPPSRSAAVSRRRPGSAARDETIKRANRIGRRQWKKESGYQRQGTVENTLFRHKSMRGDRPHARIRAAQDVEVGFRREVLNRMLAFGRRKSMAIAR